MLLPRLIVINQYLALKYRQGLFTKTYKNGDTIALPFLNGHIVVKPGQSIARWFRIFS